MFFINCVIVVNISYFLCTHSIIYSIIVFAAIQLEVVSYIQADIRSDVSFQNISGKMQI